MGKGLNLPGRGEAGLFHTALLFDTQADLAATVLSAAQFDGSLFTGSSDHLVSEAFYFNDPEGNGIELYFDRPRDTWKWNGDTIAMDTIYLDPNDYLNKHLNEQAVSELRTTRAGIGHVHLQVGDVPMAEKFYVDTLGFAKTTSFHGQALFVSAGGYHHHMAMNVWNSRGAGPRKDTLGLGEVLITVPNAGRGGRARRPPQGCRRRQPPHGRRTALRGSVAQPAARRRWLRQRCVDMCAGTPIAIRQRGWSRHRSNLAPVMSDGECGPGRPGPHSPFPGVRRQRGQ